MVSSIFRPPAQKNAKGRSYGGAAIMANTVIFSFEKINILVPSNLEVIWGLVKPRDPSAKFKQIIACSFYSPPNKQKNSKMSDHIVSTLHMLCSKYPESAIILGADRNNMDITPILNCGLKLHQIVNQNTRKDRILDILIMNTSSYYKTPVIAPPLLPDNPNTGKPSDHSVPVCIPHLDRHKPPVRKYRVIKYRPLPESGLDKFGKWIVSQSWDDIQNINTPTEQAKYFENLLALKLNSFCPEKELKIRSQDKPFITAELKRIDRHRNREYCKRGKTQKYFELKKLFESKFKLASQKHLARNVEALREAKPGHAFSVLKRLGARPGDSEGGTFTLPVHDRDNLSAQQSAERIVQHFAAVSQEFPPLNESSLPIRVRNKLLSRENPPRITEYDVYKKVRAGKKPRSGIPNDLPKEIIQEFCPELASPLHMIISNIFKSGEWPSHWKLEHVIPISKIPTPESEDDLRPISLTPFFSKVTEHFVVMWLLTTSVKNLTSGSMEA